MPEPPRVRAAPTTPRATNAPCTANGRPAQLWPTQGQQPRSARGCHRLYVSASCAIVSNAPWHPTSASYQRHHASWASQAAARKHIRRHPKWSNTSARATDITTASKKMTRGPRCDGSVLSWSSGAPPERLPLHAPHLALGPRWCHFGLRLESTPGGSPACGTPLRLKSPTPELIRRETSRSRTHRRGSIVSKNKHRRPWTLQS